MACDQARKSHRLSVPTTNPIQKAMKISETGSRKNSMRSLEQGGHNDEELSQAQDATTQQALLIQSNLPEEMSSTTHSFIRKYWIAVPGVLGLVLLCYLYPIMIVWSLKKDAAKDIATRLPVLPLATTQDQDPSQKNRFLQDALGEDMGKCKSISQNQYVGKTDTEVQKPSQSYTGGTLRQRTVQNECPGTL